MNSPKNNKTLMLLRHARTEKTASDGSDHARILTDTGREEATRLAAWWREQGLATDQALCSTAARTRETLEILSGGGADTGVCEFRQALYLAAPGDIFREVQSLPERCNSVLIVGHNPAMTEMAMLLPKMEMPELMRYEPCTLAVFSLAIDHWKSLAPGTGRLESLWRA